MAKSIQNLDKGYQSEISYQQKMIKNLQHWQSFFSMIVCLSILLTYFFVHRNVWLFGTGLVLGTINILIVFIIGYAIYRGQQNVSVIVERYDEVVKPK
ncbi:PTS sugar transporter [Leuconostoc mesenteroides]|uniref:PTS sugar transporter n=2 Tax=Leuconostoc mesenteroides TaxID=1245 RepID=UPI0021824DF0|nr:PTS sugar transporter [Leuconostoc mesenteroides]MCS8586298.1 PTS sugar transporter [Leuconostoc mesenteroides]